MATVHLKIPILVQRIKIEERPHYHLRPLFTGYPVAINRQFNHAVNYLKREVKEFFKNFALEQENMDQLLWFQFRPELDFRQYEVDFHLRRQPRTGLFSLATFEAGGYTFGCLPSFGNYLFIVSPAGEGDRLLLQRLKQVVQQLMRHYQQTDDGFEAAHYFSKRREFLTDVSVNISIGHGPFKFSRQPDNWLFSLFGSDHVAFNGALEIEKVGYELNSLYPADLQRAHYVDPLVDRVFQVVFQGEATPLVLVGDEGVGRHTLIHEVVWRYQSNYYQLQRPLLERVWHIDPTRIIAGMSVVGMWEKRFEAILEYVRHPAENQAVSDKLLIDNPVALLRIGRSMQSNMNLSDVLQPYLEKRQLPLILIATTEEWKIMQEHNRRFSDLFQVIRLPEPDFETAVRIVLQRRRELELRHDVIIDIRAIRHLLNIHRNYLRNKPLPGGILRLLEQLAVKHRFGRVDAPEVREEFKAFSGMEERIFDADDPLEPDELYHQIGQQLIGQPHAVRALADVVHLVRSRLADKSRPVSSFLFVGPTGVGKTQAAKVLCRQLMGSEEYLLRLDMNEYINDDAVDRLIGNAMEPEGQLTGKVRYRPFGILLLDEIEKAHEKVRALLLQVLDDGRLTDSLGRTVDFSNIIIIMTSNLGAREVKGQVTFQADAKNDAAIYRAAIESFFPPEFVNRIDQIVVFRTLALDHVQRIARLQIRDLLQRDGFVRRTTILNISREALEWVATRGYDERMGGRALKRQIERDLTALSAEQLLSTYTDNPILLDIHFQDEKLLPRITELRFAEPLSQERLPELPDNRWGRSFYQTLLDSLDLLSKRIRELEEEHFPGSRVFIGEDSSGPEWLYFDFKTRLNELRDEVTKIMLGFQDPYYKHPPAAPLRLKRVTTSYQGAGIHGDAPPERERFFREEYLKEIRVAVEYGSDQFDSFKSEFLDHYLNVALLHLFSKGFFDDRPEEAVLAFEPLITAMGAPETAFLMECYSKLFEAMDLHYRTDAGKGKIYLNGFGISDLLEGEQGIHLFHSVHHHPLPIQVSLRVNNDDETPDPPRHIIRVYDGSRTLTDLRTGYSNEIDIYPKELKLLVYAGIAPKKMVSRIRLEREDP